MDRLESFIQGKPIVPLCIELGTGPVCNLNCIYCSTEFQRDHKAGFLKRDIFLRLMEDAASVGVKSICIIGDGEPLLNPATEEAVFAGKKAGMDISLCTNGIHFSGAKVENILRALTWIRFTLGAADKKSYARLCRTKEADFAQVIRNIKNTTDIKKEKALNVTIGINCVLVPGFEEQIVPLTRLSKSLRVDYIAIKQASLSPRNEFSFDLRWYHSAGIQDKLKQAEKEGSADFSVFVYHKKMLDYKKKYSSCQAPAFLLQISGKGQVYPCNDLVGNEDFLMGDLNKKSFKEIISSRRYSAVLKRLAERDLSACATCCRHDSINALLHSLQHPPMHINFI